MLALTGSAKEIVAHEQSEPEANRIVELLAREGIEAAKVKDQASRELSFNIQVPKEDEVRTYAILVKHNLPEKVRDGTARRILKPGQVFSRIHVDDIVGALSHCLALPAPARPPLVNSSDDCPCPSGETLGFAAHLLGCTLPPVQTFASVAASMGPMALSFWAENRRVSNRRLCQELGYSLRYPSYREGYLNCLAGESAAAGPGCRT
jgi:nucleoside-diphosphate-sugar epimerase